MKPPFDVYDCLLTITFCMYTFIYLILCSYIHLVIHPSTQLHFFSYFYLRIHQNHHLYNSYILSYYVIYDI